MIKNETEREDGKILVVDDDQLVCQIIQKNLESEGFAVSLASDAETAYRLIEKNCYDAIFVDIIMPGENGLIALGQIKQQEPGTPIVMITGMPSVDTAAAAVRLDAFDYLSKPLRKGELLWVARRAVETKRLITEKQRLESENIDYQRKLERMVEERTSTLYYQKEFLENILEALTSPLYVVNTEDYQITTANSAAGFGEISCNSQCFKLTHLGTDPCENKEQCPVWKIMETQKPFQVEHNHFDKNGDLFIARVHGYPLFDSNKTISQIIVYVVDITDQKRLESIASAKNMMQNIGYVFSGIRHEIGNPINSLKTCLTVLKKQINILDTKEIKEFVTDALLETDRVEYLLKSLKNFSLFEHPEVKSTDLTEFIEGMEPLFRKDLEDRGISFEIHLARTPCRGLVSLKAMHHVMLNLLSNAVDALASRDNPKIEIHLKEQSSQIEIDFIDNGCGMTEREKSELFKPFHTTKSQGTGLGLVMVRKMLASMDCSIKISSWKDVGTLITISIPKAGYEI